MKKARWFIILLTMCLMMLLATAVFAETNYTAQPNDSLSSIAARFGTNYLVLAAHNDIESPYVIQVGQIIRIPDGLEGGTQPTPPTSQPATPATAPPAAQEAASIAPAASSAPGTYTVQSGDSLSRIAGNFGTNYLVLAALNDLAEPYVLSIGQVLQVPGAPAAPAAADPATEAAAPDAPAAPAAAPPAPVAAPNFSGGFEYGGQTQSFANRDLMKNIGMNWVKFQHKWSPGDSPDAVAGRINDAHASGFKVLLSIPGANTYPAPGGIDFASYVEFLRGVAALGPDGIEIWNEMNIDFEWPAGEIDPASYVNNMLAPSYNAIKSANPNVLVVAGAPAPTGFDNGTNAWADDRYIAGMAAAGASRYMDCMGVHHNAGATSPNATSGHPAGSHYSWYFWPTLNLYYNTFGRPVCFTELGYVTPEGYPGISPQFGWAANNTLSQQAQWLSEAVSLSSNSGKVRLMIIFNVDFTHYDPNGDPQAGYAIVRPDGGCPFCGAMGG